MKDEEMWAGKFGDEYTRRCVSSSLSRFRVWEAFLTKHEMSAFDQILEVGCGDGKNIFCMPWAYGIEINWTARKEAQKKFHVSNIVYGRAQDIPFKDNFFELVFTCGLLIHIPTEDLITVMSEMVRCSKKYVMFMEYFAEKEEKIEYRDGVGLWKRPYKEIFTKRYCVPYEIYWAPGHGTGQYEIPWGFVDEGFLGKEDGFDDITWWLFERK